MARINIEDCWWTDPRRELLGQLLGDPLMADAVVIRAWRIAQEFWGKGRQLIPLKVWGTIQAGAKLIQANLAEEREGGVYVCGSSEYLEWVNEQREKARIGGKKSAQRPRNAKGQLTKVSKLEPSRVQVESKQSQASDSDSYSDSDSDSDSSSGSSSDSGWVDFSPAKPSGPEDIPKVDLNRKIWDSYAKAYFARYKTEPVRNAKVNGQVSQLAKRLGEEAPDVVRFYLGHPKTFYLSKMHEFGLCLSDAEALRTQWAKGRAITNSDLKRFEKSVADRELDQLIDEGKI